jgi:hypothetical protein
MSPYGHQSRSGNDGDGGAEIATQSSSRDTKPQQSRTASPGRAAQITASAESSQMLSQGVMLQTMAQMTQLQAMNLELQKSEIERNLYSERNRRRVLGAELLRRNRP